MDQLPRFGKRELIYMLLFTCNHVVSERQKIVLQFRGLISGQSISMTFHFLSGVNLVYMVIDIKLTFKFSEYSH